MIFGIDAQSLGIARRLAAAGGALTLAGQTGIVAVNSPTVAPSAGSLSLQGNAGAVVTGAPTAAVVQQASRGGQAGTITLPAAPTPGNLLLSFLAHWDTGISTGSDFTLLQQNTGTTLDCYSIFYRVAQPGDGAGPWVTHTGLASDDRGGEIMFEVSGQNATWDEGQDIYTDQPSASSFVITSNTVNANDLVLGILDCMGGGAFGVTMTGADATYAFNTTQRTFRGFSKLAPSPGSNSFSVTFSGAAQWLSAVVRVKSA